MSRLENNQDVEGINHLLKCPDCRLYIQMREQSSSEAEMDITLYEILERIGVLKLIG